MRTRHPPPAPGRAPRRAARLPTSRGQLHQLSGLAQHPDLVAIVDWPPLLALAVELLSPNAYINCSHLDVHPPHPPAGPWPRRSADDDYPLSGGSVVRRQAVGGSLSADFPWAEGVFLWQGETSSRSGSDACARGRGRRRLRPWRSGRSNLKPAGRSPRPPVVPGALGCSEARDGLPPRGHGPGWVGPGSRTFDRRPELYTGGTSDPRGRLGAEGAAVSRHAQQPELLWAVRSGLEPVPSAAPARHGGQHGGHRLRRLRKRSPPSSPRPRGWVSARVPPRRAGLEEDPVAAPRDPLARQPLPDATGQDFLELGHGKAPRVAGRDLRRQGDLLGVRQHIQ